LDAVWYRLAESTADASLPDDPLARACTYLAFHLHESVRLSFLAEYVAKISPGHLARLFREQHNVSFTGYLRELRMQKAADLVRRTLLPVQRIAARVGYDDPSRFATHFRRRFGLTPRDFRRQFGGPELVAPEAPQ
jgi:AraC-like DNA-binding protein